MKPKIENEDIEWPKCGMCDQQEPHSDLYALDDGHCIYVCDDCLTDLYYAAQRVGDEVVSTAIRAYLKDRGVTLVRCLAPSGEVLNGLQGALQEGGILPKERPWKKNLHDRLVDDLVEHLEAGGKELLDYETVAAELDGDPDIREATLSLLRKGIIEAARLEDGQIAFRAVDVDLGPETSKH